ncbi:MAG: hypothetical protein AAF335_03850, partial [Bacteroidota bacterium]
KMPTNLAENKETTVYLTLENLDRFLTSQRDHLLTHLQVYDGLLFFFFGHGGSVKDKDFIHRKYEEYQNFQYITTFNQSELPALVDDSEGFFDFNAKKSTILSLTSTPDKMLFKRDFA